MKIIIIACFFVAVAAQELRPKPCGTNELYSNCGANGCQSTCANPTLNLVCKGTCIAGCICKEGYLRDSNGKCILAKDCPIICKGLEIFSDCAPNACKKTCDTLNTACRAPCVPGCKCPNNFVYSDKTKTKCIPIKACPQNKCKKFEIFSDCAPLACQKTCDTLNTACRAPCVPGCKCPEGLVYKDNNKNACIIPEECPQII